MDKLAESSTEEAVAKVFAAVCARVRDDPYRTLGVAAALGLVGGAGYWRRLASSLVGAGVRVALAAVVPTIIGALAAKEPVNAR
jgi:hypothetical protein